MEPKYKTYANTFIYAQKVGNDGSAEQPLLEFIMKADRIDKSSDAFKPVLEAIKTRQTTAVLYRIMMMDSVVLCMYTKELPASFKVFTAVDVRSVDKQKKIFIDLTGLVKYANGYFTCKEIDKLSAYLLAVLVNAIYYAEPARIYNNASIIRSGAMCYTKMFTGVLDYLRLINYSENKTKISYIVAVYFLCTMMNKDVKSASSAAATMLSIPYKDASAYDIYFDSEKDFESIDVFVQFLAETFKLKGLTTDVFLDRWMYLYGKGTMYGVELLPAFLIIITNAYSGSYINHQKRIEGACGRDMVTVANTILQIGADMYDKGFHYESAYTRK